MTQEEIRKMFPALNAEVYGKGKNVVYFDNAATTQRAQSVIDGITRNEIYRNANIHRAVHKLSTDATDAYIEARKKVAEYIGIEDENELIFTSGTTASINLAAYSFGEKYIKEGDEIIISEAEHHSNLVPWQQLCKKKKASLKFIEIEDTGRLKYEDLENQITEKTKLISVAHISNVLGLVNPVEEIVRIAHEKGVPVMIDGAQGIAHEEVDLSKIDADFYAFSGHKIFGPTGTGVLYGKRKYLEEMPPFLYGGDMVGNVSKEETTFAELPMKFEAGTQNFNSISALSETIDFNRTVREDKELQKEFEKASEYLYSWLKENDEIILYGTEGKKVPVYSFNVKGVHHEDLATLLDKMRIAVRSGQMCAEPLMNRFGVTGMVRVSLSVYNTIEEVKYFTECMEKAVKMLK